MSDDNADRDLPVGDDLSRHYYAACTLGLEEVLAEELRGLGAQNVDPGRGGARFEGDRLLGYRAALWLRTAVRLQQTIASADVDSEDALYEFGRSIDWTRYMRLDDTLAVDASVRDGAITHSRYAAQKLKDAVVDQFRASQGRRPSVDTRRPTLPIKLHLQGTRVTLYRDLGGDSMHKRGYRPVQVKSPLNESIAAGLVLLSGWDCESPLCDPMCGSGTIAIEAAWIALDRAPGLRRAFAFERWPDFDRSAWRSLLDDAMTRSRKKELPPIEVADQHPGAIAIARDSLRNAGLGDRIPVTHASLQEFDPKRTPACVITNPPYGERIGRDDADASWHDLGNFLREVCPESVAWVLCGNPDLAQLLRFKTSRRIPIHNGPIDCRLLRYEVGPRR